MAALDWGIVIIVFCFMAFMALNTRKYCLGVADFLAAGRCAKRYVICVAQGQVFLSGIGIITYFELYYQGGFSAQWWYTITGIIWLIVALSGWVFYRYRQTRALTWAQFLEIRYSRRFRIFAGLIAWFSGIVNFGIFPAIGARFFVYFCGFPQEITVAGLAVPTFVIVMVVLLALALFFTLVGGQISVIVTDFLQGIFCNVAFMIIIVVCFTIFSWDQITTALTLAPADASLVHPFRSSQMEDVNVWFFLILAFAMFYNIYPANQGYNAAAKNAHEARMGNVLSQWRYLAALLLHVFIAICAYTLLHHPAFAEKAALVHDVLSNITNPSIQKQVTVPVAMTQFLRPGLMGAFAAVILGGLISVHDTYLHTWGSVFLQDVIMPFRKKPFEPKEHVRYLKFSIFGVAVFIFLFSWFFRQVDYIYMFMLISGTIFTGGGGVAIIGGLYWKRGTTAAAFAAMITGIVLCLAGLAAQQICRSYYEEDFFLNGAQIGFFTSMICIVLYGIISLVQKKDFNMDRMLHRGKYRIEEDVAHGQEDKVAGWRARLGITNEFTFADKLIYYGSIAWSFFWFVIFVSGCIYNLFVDVSDIAWMSYWRFWIWLFFIMAVFTTVWLTIGGAFDLKELFRILRTRDRDDTDDGRVLDQGGNDEKQPLQTNPLENQR